MDEALYPFSQQTPSVEMGEQEVTAFLSHLASQSAGFLLYAEPGYFNYYGVKGNAVGIQEFHGRAMKILLKWLNRRSQRRSFNWKGFKDLLDHFDVPRPRIMDQPRLRTSAGVWRRINTQPNASRA